LVGKKKGTEKNAFGNLEIETIYKRPIAFPSVCGPQTEEAPFK